MANELKKYTYQTFRDTARTRAREARALITGKPRRCDGGATCGLLAVECALKCLLLHGNQTTRVSDLSPELQAGAFRSKQGHNITYLWNLLPESIRANATPEVTKAIPALHRLDRYEHRYGARRPGHQHASGHLDSVTDIIDWMEKLTS